MAPGILSKLVWLTESRTGVFPLLHLRIRCYHVTLRLTGILTLITIFTKDIHSVRTEIDPALDPTSIIGADLKTKGKIHTAQILMMLKRRTVYPINKCPHVLSQPQLQSIPGNKNLQFPILSNFLNITRVNRTMKSFNLPNNNPRLKLTYLLDIPQ